MRRLHHPVNVGVHEKKEQRKAGTAEGTACAKPFDGRITTKWTIMKAGVV